MKTERTKKQERVLAIFISILLITALSFVFFYLRNNFLYTNRDRLIILCYQTNISGSDSEQWAKYLKENNPDVPDFEVSVYDTKSAGNDTITITTENGWNQISTRLFSGEGDILFVDNATFYNVLLDQNLLIPLSGNFENPITDKNGTVYGIDVTRMTADGLLNYGTSKYVGKGQKLPIMPLDEKTFIHNGFNYSPKVIAVIFKGSEKVEQSQKLLNNLFGVIDYE